MINTLYNLDALGTPRAFLLALLIGIGFGFALDRAGFSSSRRLAGVFFFFDMAVVKVMFTAVLTAMLGLSYLSTAGWFSFDRVFLMPTIYGAQIIGGLIFGVGFVMGGWCPGTAASGAASGKIDAVVFLVGAVGGSIIFNELFPVVKPLYTMGNRGVRFIYEDLGTSHGMFAVGLTIVGVVVFWLCEWVEKLRNGRSTYLGSPFLKAFSVAFIAAAAGLLILKPDSNSAVASTKIAASVESEFLAAVDGATDHIEPEELADRLMAGESGLTVVDVRPAEEFASFHIRGAINIPLAELAQALEPQKNAGTIVLYSNGMTHPAQARDSLQRLGFSNAFILTDGIVGFRERCLMPVSLRSEPLDNATATRVNAWQAYFSGEAAPATATATLPAEVTAQRLVDTAWLADQLGTPNLKLIDLRSQPEYNTSHIPGSLNLNLESFRGNVNGVPSLLLPPQILAAHFSLMGLEPTDTVLLVPGDKIHDATIVSMAFERLGHSQYAILTGGFGKWLAENRPVDAVLPTVNASSYPAPAARDSFTVDYREVAAAIGKPGIVILDVRPAAYYSGEKSDEARAGHIPGAINRPFSEDVDSSVSFKPTEELAVAYSALIPNKQTRVIVHCRTGHQASQTFFVLKHLLGYTDVRWYDASWTEWAAKPGLPVER